MFEKYFLGFLASRAKTDDYQAAWQKKSYFYRKRRERKWTNYPTYTRTYIFKKMNSRENLKSSNVGPLYFNLVFSSKAKIFINSAPSSFSFFTDFCSKIIQFQLLMKICFQINFWAFFQHLVLEVNLRID